jgi:hypothetical protein
MLPSIGPLSSDRTEAKLESARAAYEDPAIASDAERLIAAQTELERFQTVVDDLYARWEQLENKIS